MQRRALAHVLDVRVCEGHGSSGRPVSARARKRPRPGLVGAAPRQPAAGSVPAGAPHYRHDREAMS
eukprot:5312942-Prymnesium_polylepis.1